MPKTLTDTVEWIARQRLSFHEAALLLEAVDHAIDHHGVAVIDPRFHIEHAIEEAKYQHEKQMAKEAA